MYKNLRWKIPLIMAVLIGAILLAYPLKEKITLGLDLQGGMHLVLEVQVEKAVEASLDRVADDIKRNIEKEDLEIDRIKANYNGYKININLVDTLDIPDIEKILGNYSHLEKQETDSTKAQLIYSFALNEVDRIRENAVNQGLETIRNRVDQFGVSEPTIQRQGERRILIQLPGIKDTERAIKINR